MLLVLGGAGFAAVKRFSGPSNEQRTKVRVEPAKLGELVEIVFAPGTVVPETKVSISARVSARIVELPYREGQIVTKGNPTSQPATEPSVLVKLDASDIDAQLRAARARYDAQKADIDTAEARLIARQSNQQLLRVQLESRQRDLARQQALLATNDVAQQAVDDLQSQVDQLVAQIEGDAASIEADRRQLRVLQFQLAAAQADIDRIAEQLTYTTIVSPIDGIVTRVAAEVGEIAMMGTMNNAGTVILEVADLGRMIVEARVDESDITQVKVGQTAQVRMEAFPETVFVGTVQTVALQRTEVLTDRSTYYKVEILLDTQGKRVLSGLNADVEIQTRKNENVVTVPSQAVLGRSTDDLPADIRSRPEVDVSRTMTTVVYRMVDGKAVITPVRVGASDITRTILRSGIAEGETIITGPFRVLDTLKHDQPVEEDKATTQPATAPTS